MKENLFPKTTGGADESYDVSRRHFFQLAGGLAGAGMLFAACNKTSTSNNDLGYTPPAQVSLGPGDKGILNYAYALEQLEAAFYSKVVGSAGFGTIFPTLTEQALMIDIRDHEIAHREFFKAALGSNAIGSLTVDFSTIDFNSRASVLGAARTFEDLGVSAYNYAGTRISTAGASYLILAGKIVSVEARHAAAIRNMIAYSNFSFADTLDENGLDQYNDYQTVLSAAATYVKTTIDYSQLP